MENSKDGQITVYTTEWCPACWRAKQVMNSMKIAYREVDITRDPHAAELVMRINRGYRSVPTLIFPDGSTLTEPRTSDLVQKLQAIAAATSATPGAAS